MRETGYEQAREKTPTENAARYVQVAMRARKRGDQAMATLYLNKAAKCRLEAQAQHKCPGCGSAEPEITSDGQVIDCEECQAQDMADHMEAWDAAHRDDFNR